jgi:hypothetical protein
VFDNANCCATEPPVKVKAKRNWRPGVIRVRWLLSLGILLTLILVAILTLNAFSMRSQLSQLAFIYEANVSKLGLSFSTFAPISIAPTLSAIIIGLWWDQLDSTFRVLQPFISMSRGPTPICDGAGLTYRSRTWLGAAVKSGRQRHWVLFMICMGSLLAQVLTVSMSALFERETRNVVRTVSVERHLEMRQVPLITEVNTKGETPVRNPALKVLDTLYTDVRTNWLYGAGIQHSYNGSQLPWTSEGWSFLPVDLATIPIDTGLVSPNVTLGTFAIRARLNCRPIYEIANSSSWIEAVHLSNDDEEYETADFARIENTTKVDSYSLRGEIFPGTDSHTTSSSGPGGVKCCSNGTSFDRAVLGYWSPIYPPNSSTTKNVYPYTSLSWPLSISTKWIVGSVFNLTQGRSGPSLFFTEVPKIQAARCEPIIETAEAVVTVDPGTGNVISHSIKNTVASDEAWADVFTKYQPDPTTRLNASSLEPMNVTASFEVLFLDSLLGTIDRYIGGAAEDNAFSFRDRDNGMAMDLMTYSMFTLADKKPESLLNYTTLAEHADQTFQAFFQHFVNSGLSLDKGGYAYQPINDNSMEAIGKPMGDNNTAMPQKKFPVLNTSPTVTASISHRIRVLHMNTIATYLSTAILTWLILTTLIVTCLQRKYTSFMNRDVQLIADMLILVAGSDNFLELVAEKGVELKKNKDIKTMLGWFRDRDGQVRWGIEVVGGRDAVVWEDAPKQGFHTLGPSSRSMLGWWKF